MSKEQSFFYINQLNDSLHGRYPMSEERLAEEIMKVDPAYQVVDVNHNPIGMLKADVYCMMNFYNRSWGIKDRYAYYIEKVKPFQL